MGIRRHHILKVEDTVEEAEADLEVIENEIERQAERVENLSRKELELTKANLNKEDKLKILEKEEANLALRTKANCIKLSKDHNRFLSGAEGYCL